MAIGDVHLGMRPGSLPEELDREGVDPRDLTPEAALLAAVESAIEFGVDAVLFAGDVVESTNARYEALRPLEFAVKRLLDAKIRVLAVVGNHDVEALPRLARMIEGFELLGEGGRWQARVIEKTGNKTGNNARNNARNNAGNNARNNAKNDAHNKSHDKYGEDPSRQDGARAAGQVSGVAVELLGWSFPERQVRSSPVDRLLRNPIAPARPGIVRIGLLHADLDTLSGHYAPITSRELGEVGLDAWLLGHIHKPSLPESSRAEFA